MVLPVPRPGSLLEQARAIWQEHGWPETDLARFRMALDDDAGTDDGAGDDDEGDDDTSDKGDDDVARMKKALAKANKEAEKARLKLKEIEDAGKSETQRVTEERDSLKGELTAAQVVALRYEIALDKGIPKSIATRLQGSTREEMEADAEDLLKTLGDAGNGRKTPRFDGGAKENEAPAGGSFLSKALRDRRGA